MPDARYDTAQLKMGYTSRTPSRAKGRRCSSSTIYTALSLAHLVPSYDATLRQIGQGRSLIRYDMRGTGLSQRDVDDLSPCCGH